MFVSYPFAVLQVYDWVFVKTLNTKGLRQLIAADPGYIELRVEVPVYWINTSEYTQSS